MSNMQTDSRFIRLLFFFLCFCATQLMGADFEGQLTPQEKEWRDAHPVVYLGFGALETPLLAECDDEILINAYSEVCRELTRIVGIRFEVTVGRWEQMANGVQSRKIDGLLIYSDKHAEVYKLDRTSPLLTLSPSLLTRDEDALSVRTLADLNNKRVAYSTDSLLLGDLIDALGDKVIRIQTPSSLVAAKAVLNSDADVALELSHATNREKPPLAGMYQVRIPTEHVSKILIGVREDWPELVDIMNKGLDELGTVRIQQILGKSICSRPPSSDVPLTTQERQWLRDNPVIKIAVEAHAAPHSYINERGEHTGILADVLNKVASDLGIEFSYLVMDYDGLVTQMKKGKCMIIGGVDPLDDPTYDERYSKTDDVLFMPFALFARAGHNAEQFVPGKIEGKKIAILEGWDPSHPALLALGDCHFVSGKSVSECINMVLRGQADAVYDIGSVVNFELKRQMISEVQLAQVTTFGMPLTLLVSEDQDVLYSALVKALAMIDQRQRIALLEKWQASLDSPSYRLLTVDLTEEERKWLMAHPIIRLGCGPGYYPMEWYDEKGQYCGVVADYCDVISSYLGIEFEYVPHQSWERLARATRVRKLDAVACTTVAEEHGLLFTPPYLSLGLKLFVRADDSYIHDLRELNGKRLAVVSTHAVVEMLRKDYPEIQLVRVPSLKDAILTLESQEVDAFVGDLLTTGHQLTDLGIETIKVAGDTPYDHAHTIGIRDDWPVLASIMTKALNSIPREERALIYRRWAPLRTQIDYSIIWQLGVPLAIVLFIVSAWSWLLRREVARRTSELLAGRERLEYAEKIASLGHWQLNLLTNDLIWSRQLYRILGEDPNSFEPVADDFFGIVHCDERAEFHKRFRTAVDSHSSFDHDVRIQLKNGVTKYAHFQCRAENDGAGVPVLLVGTLQDITERKAMEETLCHSEKLRAIGQLTGGIAHDFNNMLTAIMGAAELIGCHSETGARETEYQKIILNTCKRATSLTQELLSFSRKQPISTVVTNVHALIKDTVSLLRSSVDRQISIGMELNASQATVIGDPSQLQNVILNLGVNASHAISGSGHVTIVTETLVFDDSYCAGSSFDITPGPFIDIEVRDTGCGMSRDMISRIFEPFFTTKQEGNGTGLGLSVAFGTIQQHHGAISVYSEVGIGTCFHVFLPLVDNEPSAKAEVNALVGGKETILLVDDDDMVRTTARAILESLGYNVCVAENGMQGLEVYGERQETVDLVILDVTMPVMNGQDCFYELQKHDPSVKVLLASGFALEDDLDELRQAGLRGFVRKPFLRGALSRAIREALGED